MTGALSKSGPMYVLLAGLTTFDGKPRDTEAALVMGMASAAPIVVNGVEVVGRGAPGRGIPERALGDVLDEPAVAEGEEDGRAPMRPARFEGLESDPLEVMECLLAVSMVAEELAV